MFKLSLYPSRPQVMHAPSPMAVDQVFRVMQAAAPVPVSLFAQAATATHRLASNSMGIETVLTSASRMSLDPEDWDLSPVVSPAALDVCKQCSWPQGKQGSVGGFRSAEPYSHAMPAALFFVHQMSLTLLRGIQREFDEADNDILESCYNQLRRASLQLQAAAEPLVQAAQATADVLTASPPMFVVRDEYPPEDPPEVCDGAS